MAMMVAVVVVVVRDREEMGATYKVIWQAGDEELRTDGQGR